MQIYIQICQNQKTKRIINKLLNMIYIYVHALKNIYVYIAVYIHIYVSTSIYS